MSVLFGKKYAVYAPLSPRKLVMIIQKIGNNQITTRMARIICTNEFFAIFFARPAVIGRLLTFALLIT